MSTRHRAFIAGAFKHPAQKGAGISPPRLHAECARAGVDMYFAIEPDAADQPGRRRRMPIRGGGEAIKRQRGGDLDLTFSAGAFIQQAVVDISSAAHAWEYCL